MCEEGGVHVRIEEGKCVGVGCVRGRVVSEWRGLGGVHEGL